MATNRFDDILKLARDKLNSDEQRELVVELSKQGEATEGATGEE